MLRHRLLWQHCKLYVRAFICLAVVSLFAVAECELTFHFKCSVVVLEVKWRLKSQVYLFSSLHSDICRVGSKGQFFWAVTLCRWVRGFRFLEGTWCVGNVGYDPVKHLDLPDDLNFQQHRCDNFKFRRLVKVSVIWINFRACSYKH